MAYVKRSRRPRRYARRPLRTTIAKIAKSVFNKKVENKYQIYDLATLGGVGSSGVLMNINVLGQGTGITNRIGNRVKFSSVRFNGYWTYNDQTNIVRMMCLWSRAPLQLANLPAVAQPINPGNQNFKVLYDWTTNLESLASSGIMNKVLSRTVYRKIGGNSTYDDGTTTPEAGFLYFYFVSDSAVTGHPFFTGQAIMSYQDA